SYPAMFSLAAIDVVSPGARLMMFRSADAVPNIFILGCVHAAISKTLASLRSVLTMAYQFGFSNCMAFKSDVTDSDGCIGRTTRPDCTPIKPSVAVTEKPVPGVFALKDRDPFVLLLAVTSIPYAAIVKLMAVAN